MRICYVLLNLLIGYFSLAVFTQNNKSSANEASSAAAIVVAGNILLQCFAALGLTLLQIYSLQNLCITLSFFFLALLIYCIYKKSYYVKWIRLIKNFRRSSFAVALIFLAGAFLYFNFPITYMLGGRDPGLYFLNGIHIAETGSYQYETDEYLNEHYEELADFIILGYPGLYSVLDFEELEGTAGDIVPQFMPMFPSVLAIGYDLAGIDGMIRVNGVISLAALMVIYCFVKRYFSRSTAVLSVLLLIISPAQLWTARNTLSEILSQLLFFTSMLILVPSWKKDNKYRLFLSGVLLGIGVMNRIDTYIYGVGLFLVLIYLILWSKPGVKKAVWTVAGYILAGTLSFVYGMIYSAPYFIKHWENGSLSLVVILNLACMTGVIFALGLRLAIRKWKIVDWIEGLVSKDIYSKRLSIFLLIVFAVVYFIRPLLGDQFSQRAMVEFCWYTSISLVILAILGLYYFLVNYKKDSEPFYIFLLICIVSTAAYIYNPSITPDHIWASRRWVTVNIPFIIILGSYGLTQIKEYNRILKPLIVAFLCCFMLFQNKSFIFTRIMDGLDDQIAEIAGQMEDDEIYFTDNEEVASYLRYVYNKKIYRLDSSKMISFIEYIDIQGGVRYLGSQETLKAGIFEYEVLEDQALETSGQFLEKVYSAYPRNLYTRIRDASLFTLIPSSETSVQLGDGTLIAGEGIYEESGQLSSTGKAGYVFYGPYLSLKRGSYQFEFNLEAQDLDGKEIYLEIICELGNTLINKYLITSSGVQWFSFELEENTDNVEIRLYVRDDVFIICSDMKLKKMD